MKCIYLANLFWSIWYLEKAAVLFIREKARTESAWPDVASSRAKISNCQSSTLERISNSCGTEGRYGK